MRTYAMFCAALSALSVSSGFAVAAPPSHAPAYGLQRHEGFQRGERLPPAYRHRNYVVEDWRGHRLPAPPRGHHWVEIGADYLLVAIATGLIVQAMTAPPPVPSASVGASQPPAAAVFYYFCDSANAYYPYARQCPEGWRVVPTTPPGPVR